MAFIAVSFGYNPNDAPYRMVTGKLKTKVFVRLGALSVWKRGSGGLKRTWLNLKYYLRLTIFFSDFGYGKCEQKRTNASCQLIAVSCKKNGRPGAAILLT